MPSSPSSRQVLRALLREKAKRAEAAERAREIRENAAAVLGRCQSLFGFVKEAWSILEPTTPFVEGWALRTICDHLEAVTRGEIQYLLINVPPGMMKSLLVSVFWPAWEWGPAGKPSLRYLSTSFSEANVLRDNTKMRRLVESEWYQSLWGDSVTFARDQNAKLKFENTATGGREGRPFGSMTGGRGDRLLIDDPHSTETAESVTERAAATRIFRESLSDRLNDLAKSAIVIIMQRLHPDDISGVIAKLGLPYVHLCLPMEFEEATRCSTPLFVDPRTYEGELLFPERFGRGAVDALKVVKGSYAYAGQYQQRPAPREGGLFKRHWFKIVPAAPANVRLKVRRWDLAATIAAQGTDPDWTVGLRMSAAEGAFYVEDVARFRDSAARVRAAIKNTAALDKRPCRIVIPQDPGQAGKDQAASIIAENAGFLISAERETGAKETRAEPLAAQCEAGNVYLVEASWNEAFIDELCSFPVGHDDQVDAAAGAFNVLAGVKGPLVITSDMVMQVMQAGRRA